MDTTPYEKFEELDIINQKKVLSEPEYVINFAPLLSSTEAHKMQNKMEKFKINPLMLQTARRKHIEKLFKNRENLKQEKFVEIKNLIIEKFFCDSLKNVNLTLDTIISLAEDDKNAETSIPNFKFLKGLKTSLETKSNFADLMKLYDSLENITTKNNNPNFVKNLLEEGMNSSVIYAGQKLVESLKLPTSENKSFALFTHTTQYNTKTNPSKEDVYNEWINPTNLKIRKDKISLCYISDKNPTFFPSGKNNVTFGFLNIDPKNIEHISPTNSFSLSKIKRNQALFSAETFAELSQNLSPIGRKTNFNEIVYRKHLGFENGKVALMPSCIISQSEKPTELEELYAEVFNIQIVKINPLEYTNPKNLEITNKWNSEIYN